MAIKKMGLVFIATCFLGLIFEPGRAHGSTKSDLFMSHGSDLPVAQTPPLVGICESFVAVHGYPCKEFKVKTQDGYVLTLHRIPEGRVKGSGKIRQPVLLQHGILMAFWAWSWDELVEHDLPALFDFVHSQTGQKLDYVGHSLGTLMALASLSQGKLVDQLKSAALLSPIAYLSHMTTSIGQIAARSFIGEITIWFGLAEFNPIGEAVATFLKALCAYPGIDCYDLMSSFTGKNCCLNVSTIDLFLQYEPQSTSTKNLVHLAQTVRDGIIAKFDYGNSETNMKYYGQSKPPIYNMSSIPNDLPLFLSYGGQDALSDVRDVELLLDNLKFHDGDKLTVQYIKDFAHADFVMGGSAKKIVYDALIAFFNRW
ncbi:triacylglycerol lipase 2-like isoform X2 [Magnolia sinica]|uniref:triacylglycerol lipase 2-like isoform X2 n=1 Tax=Magnolia sinica TaxID=86752 RepID=UPI00265992CA|nr:triacylglycerol lipase 2-like isoform X2 [Magnolia sinica]